MAPTIKPALEANQQTIHMFSLEDLAKELSYKLGKTLDGYTFSDTKTIGSYYVPVTDAIVVQKILKDLGISGQAILKNVDNKSYVILKGYPGKRSVLTGTRYLSSNPKIIKMAIGTKAVNHSILKGSLVTLAITIPLSVVDVCMKDEFSMGRLIGTVASDITKVLISSGVAGIAAMAVGAVTTIAAGPLIAAIFVGVAVGMALESLDQRYGITDKLIEAIEKEMSSFYDRTVGEFYRGMKRVEDMLEYQSINGLPVGRGIFY